MWVIKQQDGELLKETYLDDKNKLHKKVLFFDNRYQAVNYIIKECGNSPYLREEPWRN
jgi:hypothetical protein